MSPATMTEPPSQSPSDKSPPGEVKLESLGDAMKLLDQLLAKIPPSDAPALIEAALAKRKEFPSSQTSILEKDITASSLTTQEPGSIAPGTAVDVGGTPMDSGEELTDGDEETKLSEEQLVLSVLEKGYLKGIPLKTGDTKTELSKLSSQHLSPMTTALLRRGYDIRLGEKGRSDLKQEISRRSRESPDLKELCSKIARLKQANIYQLIQLAEVSGSLGKALKISQMYWKDTCRKTKQTRRSPTSVSSNSPHSSSHTVVEKSSVDDSTGFRERMPRTDLENEGTYKRKLEEGSHNAESSVVVVGQSRRQRRRRGSNEASNPHEVI